MFALLFAVLALSYKVYIALLILVSLIIQLKAIKKVNVLRFSPLTGWQCDNKQGEFEQIEIVGSTTLSQILIVLHYKMQNQQKRTMLIGKDALNKNDFRLLLVDLKISGLEKESK